MGQEQRQQNDEPQSQVVEATTTSSSSSSTTRRPQKMPDEVLGALARLELILCEWEPMPEQVHDKLSALRASLEEWPQTRGTSALTIIAPTHGRWIRAAGVLIDLKRRRPLRRLVQALVEARIERPGEGLDSAALIAAGWPGEQTHGSVALNRLYVALTRLRQLGLMDVLLSSSNGWLLSQSICVERIASDEEECETPRSASYIRELAPAI